MKYGILGFNQQKVLSLVKEVKDEKSKKITTISIDVDDLLILSVIADLSNRKSIRKVILEDGQYAWISYNLILEDLPILRIDKKQLRRRLDKLVEFDLIDLKVERVNGSGTFVYIKIGKMYEELKYTQADENMSGQISPEGVDKNVYGGGQKCTPKDSSTKQCGKNFKKDIDKSISQKDTEQGCGDKLPPSDASLPFSLASDASSPDAVGSSENTACGVNVNSFKAPLPPTPRMSSDVDVDDADNSNANKSKRKKHKAKFDVYADLSYVDEAYADIWREWLEYKDAINKQYNVQKGAISQYKSLLKYADNNVILANAIVKKSIEHSWNGLFGLSDKEKELYLSERSPYYVKSNEPALPNGMTREKYEVYIRNGYEIDEYGRIYKDGIMLK